MFDLAWSHLLLIGVVALLVIGPKDLPRALRTMGIWVGRARAIAREFQSSLDQMIREAELEEMRKQVETVAKLDLNQAVENTVDPGGELKRTFAASPIPDEVPPGETKPGAATTPEAVVAAAPEALPTAAPETVVTAAPETAPADAPAAKSGAHD
jgi:sec-independent protein translocase protein TatB